MIDTSLLIKIEAAIQTNSSFCIEDNTVTTIQKTAIFSRLIHYLHHTEIQWFKKNATRFTHILKEFSDKALSPDFTPKRLILSVKEFLNQNVNLKDTEEFKNCSLALLAFRLNIPIDALKEDHNPGFREFAEKNHLYNSLMTHNHKLLVDEKTHEIKIKYNDEYINWLYAKQRLDSFSISKPINADETYALNLYGHQGIQCEDRYNWKKLKPLLKGETANWAQHFIQDPLLFDDKNKAYIMEFCSSATEKHPRILSGDHSWIRLYSFNKTDEKIIGKMHSIGLYRPNKRHFFFDNFWKPFRVKKGYVTHDISEVWGINDEIKTIAKRITKNEYEKIIAKIENDKNENLTIFQLFQHNCDRYIGDLAKCGGVSLPTKRHFFELFIFGNLNKNNYPKPFQMIAQILICLFRIAIHLLTPVFNLLFYLAGSGSVDRNVQKIPHVRALINSFYDFFNTENLYIYSPWVLVNDVKDEIENWRSEEINKLDLENEEGKRKQKEITFSFPRQFDEKIFT